MSRLVLSFVVWTLALGAALLPARAEPNIYDAQVETKLKLDAGQRPKVRAIVAQGRKDFDAILAKYGIDPAARPVFDKLRAASDELIAYRRKQRAAIAKVLTPEQLDDYDDLIENTAIRVRKAAQ